MSSAIPNAGWYLEFFNADDEMLGDPLPFPDPAPFQYDYVIPEGAVSVRHIFIFKAPPPLDPTPWSSANADVLGDLRDAHRKALEDG